MARRRDARVAALQLLYQRDLNPEVSPAVARQMLEELVENTELREFAWDLYAGTQAEFDTLDQQIQAVAANWRVTRMTPTDRNVIRMGLFEMTRFKTAGPVVLNECIELSKLFGTEQSGPFVNGILDKLIPDAT